MKTEEERIEEIKLAVENGVTDREFWHSSGCRDKLLAPQILLVCHSYFINEGIINCYLL